MSANIHWNLLILFGVLCQGIIGTLSENNIEESTDLLLRQKRVINRTPGGDVKELIRNVPYIVSIRLFRNNHNCVGVILTTRIVLTVAKCVEIQEVELYRVYSGSAILMRGGHRIIHNVTEKKVILSGHRFRPTDGIALLTVSPSFIYSVNTHNIGFYEGHITVGSYVSITGWGCNPSGNPGTEHPLNIRTITVPLISNHACAEFYRRTLPIMESDICTLDASGNQYCGFEDSGAPLTVLHNGVKMLVGLHLWNGGVVGGTNPDVFVDLQNPRYKTWILETIHSLTGSTYINNPN